MKYLILSLFIASMFTCSPMEIYGESIENIKESQPSMLKFLKGVEDMLPIYLMEHDFDYQFELIDIDVSNRDKPLITKAITINGLKTKNPIIKIFCLSQEAHKNLLISQDHWLYHGLRNNSQTQIFIQKAHENKKFLQELIMNQVDPRISFDYEKSYLFFECTDQYEIHREAIKKSINYENEDFFKRCLKNVDNGQLEKFSFYNEINHITLNKLYQHDDNVFIGVGALVIENFKTDQRTFRFFRRKNRIRKDVPLNMTTSISFYTREAAPNLCSIYEEHKYWQEVTDSVEEEINKVKEVFLNLNKK